MPGKLRPLSGPDVAEILSSFGFCFVSQKGSHVKLRRVTSNGQRQTLNIPMHRELRSGTLRAIVRQASQYITEDQLRQRFFTD